MKYFNKESFKISIIFFIFSFIWIVYSDRFVDLISPNKKTLTILQTYKGILYILITSILIYFLVYRRMAKILKTQKILELEKQNAEKANLEKTLFLANMSHELKTPLNSIIGYSNILIKKINSEKEKNFINKINNNGKELFSIIDSILNYTKSDYVSLVLNVNEFNIVHELETIVNSFEKQVLSNNLNFISKLSSKEIFIETDIGKFTQIICNIISNSIKFTEKGYIKIELSNDDDFICVAIEDTGIGIEKSDQHLIFKPFTQLNNKLSRKYYGIGLGLSLTKQLVDLLKGRIELYSEPKIGTTFKLYFPIKFTKI